MKKGTKVKIVNPSPPCEDYKIGDILKYIGGFSFELDNGTSLVNCTLYPSEYDIIKGDLPRIVEVSNNGVAWYERELLCVLPEDIYVRYICRMRERDDESFYMRNTRKWLHMREMPKRKEMKIEEIEKKLGYKIKIAE